MQNYNLKCCTRWTETIPDFDENIEGSFVVPKVYFRKQKLSNK